MSENLQNDNIANNCVGKNTMKSITKTNTANAQNSEIANNVSSARTEITTRTRCRTVNNGSDEMSNDIQNADSPVNSSAPLIDFDKFVPVRSYIASRKRKDLYMRSLVYIATLVALIPLISLLWTVLSQGIQRLNFNFLSYNMSYVVGGKPTPSGGYGGVEHAIIGTLLITLGAMIISIPIGIMCAIYLVEYAKNNRMSRIVTFLVEAMSALPSIVAGLFAFAMFFILLGPGSINGAVGSVALAVLMLPTVIKTSVEALRVIPQDLREASYALGVNQCRTIVHVVLRTALPGVISGIILSIARVIGETAPLLLTAGYITTTNFNLFGGQMTTLPVYVYQEFSRLSVVCIPAAGPHCIPNIPMQRAWAAALVLIILVLLLNIIGRVVQKFFAVKVQ